MGMLRHSYFLRICRLSYIKSVLSARNFSDFINRQEGKSGIPPPALWAMCSFLQSFPEKYINKTISSDDCDKALCEVYIKVLNLFTTEFDKHQTALFLPVLAVIIEKIFDDPFESGELAYKAYNTIVNLIISSSFGFNYSGFKLYYRWIKQLDAEQ